MTDARPFRFGLWAQTATSATEWRDVARKAEALGYSTLFVPDHYLDRGPAAQQLAPIAALATAAAVTETLRIGCRVFCVDYHVPAVLAKETATLDLLSDGRLELGMGAGWSEAEYRAMGLEFAAAPRRVTKLEETVALLKAHWSGEELDCHGEFVNVSGYAGLPLPAQRPHPALMIGGARPRVLALAAREADIVSLATLPLRPVDGGLPPLEEATRRVGIVRDAAGDRFADLDLETAPFHTEVTDRVDDALARVAAGLSTEPEWLRNHPNVLVGTPDEMAERLETLRRITGVNYITVQQAQVDDFAPVVARLHGT